LSIKPENKALREMIETHGILLEHKTHQILLNYFENYFRQKDSSEILEHQVGKYLYTPHYENPLEIDVYFKITEFHELYSYIERVQSGDRDVSTTRFRISTQFIIQCKGHPNDGFLLCHGLNNEEKYIDEYFRKKGENEQTIPKLERYGIIIVDRADFVKINEGKSKTNKEVGGYKEIVYQEDKGKFYKAIEQINQDIESVINKLFDIFKKMDRGIGQDDQLNMGYHKIVPIIVTNCPIYLMEIKNQKVSLEMIPWAVYRNNYKPSDPDLKLWLRLRNELKNIYLVSVDYLVDFMNIFNDSTQKFDNFPTGSNKHLIEFSF